ncbi:epoxyqueuosine reductase QueH [Helicobacter cetorum]|uniref:epoxyqueuosine reductase QueH n=1 Tax=Helicobacter cetorum TaxID=138563 RepID=UPI000CF03A4A|nr:epoxyqueuosine reductase QueH [Helicobacter cetorum]
MLIHICCSVDNLYFLKKAKEAFKEEKIIGFFYNPNIHPYSEYLLRLQDVKRTCEMLEIELIEGAYELERFLDKAKGMELLGEKSARCMECFDLRLETTAQKALELGQEKFTTTLLTSPKKDPSQLISKGQSIAQKYGLEFIVFRNDNFENFNSQLDLNLQGLARENELYRQNYCGCQFALKIQKESQNRSPFELYSPLKRQVLPASVEERMEIFEKLESDKKNKSKSFLAQKTIQAYRLLSGGVWLSKNSKPLNCYILARSKSKSKIKINDLKWIHSHRLKTIVGYSQRDETLFLTLQGINTLARKSYASLEELNANPLSYEEELFVRGLVAGFESVNPIIVLEEEQKRVLFVEIKSTFQEEKVFYLL